MTTQPSRTAPGGHGAPALVAATAALLTTAALAPDAAAQQRPDFLFETPRVTVGVNLGWAGATAGSDVFDYATDEFTLDDGDFAAFAVSGELAYRLTERFDLAAELGWSRSETDSEYRDFIGTDDLPIRQTTRLSRRPFTFNVKAYLNERGRSVSDFAWVPAKWSPWVGAGAGFMWYRWEQEGEFVDYETYDIFLDRIESEGTGPVFQVMGGADVSVHRHFLITGQVRYQWADGELDDYFFEGFEDIDLSGLQATVGLKVRL